MPEKLRLYTRPGCILCSQVRGHLREALLEFEEIEVVEPAQQTELMRGIGVSSFPAIFLGNRYIGGFTHIVHLITQGRLQGLAQSRSR